MSYDLDNGAVVLTPSCSDTLTARGTRTTTSLLGTLTTGICCSEGYDATCTALFDLVIILLPFNLRNPVPGDRELDSPLLYRAIEAGAE